MQLRKKTEVACGPVHKIWIIQLRAAAKTPQGGALLHAVFLKLAP